MKEFLGTKAGENLGFTFLLYESESMLAFLTGRYAQVKDTRKRLEKHYDFSWTKRSAIIGVRKENL